jgi:hypothetical protein
MTEALTFEEAEQRLDDARKAIVDRENECAEWVALAADAEAVYRERLAARFSIHRRGGASVQESETQARRDVVQHSRERDHAAGMLKLAHERVENARDDRRSLWRLIEWSQKVATAQGRE